MQLAAGGQQVSAATLELKIDKSKNVMLVTLLHSTNIP
jgi:hypothetical protein